MMRKMVGRGQRKGAKGDDRGHFGTFVGGAGCGGVPCLRSDDDDYSGRLDTTSNLFLHLVGRKCVSRDSSPFPVLQITMREKKWRRLG